LHQAWAKRLRLSSLVALAALAAPGAAQAHRLTTVAVDYRVRVLAHSAPSMTAATQDGGRKLALSVQPDARVLVTGYEHEPFLRFSPRGVEVRLSSPTAQATGLIQTRARGWRLLSRGHTFAWADQRLVPPPGGARTHWSIPVIVTGALGPPYEVTGVSWREPVPAVWPWILGGAVLLAAAAVLLVRGRRIVAGVLLAGLAGAATTATLTGLALAGIGSSASRWLQVAAVAAVAVGGIALSVRKPGAAAVALGVVAIVAVLESVAQFGIFLHPVVLSALPGDAARALVALALALGLAVTGYSVLQTDPRSGR
jgi:hypothetical protein